MQHSGDSYSAVGYSPIVHPPPTEGDPLGIGFPGLTWAENGQPNWVGHLVTNYPPAPLLVYDFARGGDTVIGVRGQIERGFMLHLAKKPDWCPWDANDTLFGEINEICGVRELHVDEFEASYLGGHQRLRVSGNCASHDTFLLTECGTAMRRRRLCRHTSKHSSTCRKTSSKTVRVASCSSTFRPSIGLPQVRNSQYTQSVPCVDTTHRTPCPGAGRRKALRSSGALEQAASREGPRVCFKARGSDCAPLLVLGDVLARDGQP